MFGYLSANFQIVEKSKPQTSRGDQKAKYIFFWNVTRLNVAEMNLYVVWNFWFHNLGFYPKEWATWVEHFLWYRVEFSFNVVLQGLTVKVSYFFEPAKKLLYSDMP